MVDVGPVADCSTLDVAILFVKAASVATSNVSVITLFPVLAPFATDSVIGWL